MINNDLRDLFNVIGISPSTRHTETDIFPSSHVWSLFQSSLIHPLSIIHGRISPLRCTKNHSDISLLELKHQYFSDWLFVERLKRHFAPALLLQAAEWKSHSVVRTPVLVIPSPWLDSYYQISWADSLLLLHFSYSFSLIFFLMSISSFPGGENLVAARETTSPDLFIVLPVWGSFKPVCGSLLPFFWQRTSLKSKR